MARFTIIFLFLVFLTVSLKEDEILYGNLFIFPIILILMPFEITLVSSSLKYPTIKLNRKLISVFGLFQFSVESLM